MSKNPAPVNVIPFRQVQRRQPIQPTSTLQLISQLDLTELGLLEDAVIASRHEFRKTTAARDAKRKQVMAALEAGVPIEEGSHKAWLRETKRFVLA